MIRLTQDNITIEYQSSAVLEFAANEFIKYTKQMECHLQNIQLILGFGAEFCHENKINMLKDDGYCIKKTANKFVLASLLERGVLFAVYDILRENGCNFISNFGIKEKIPQKNQIEFFEKTCNPDFSQRSMINVTHLPDEKWLSETEKILDSAVKQRINGLFLHQDMSKTMHYLNNELFKIAKKRGMIIEFGGHLAQNYIDRSLFESEPDLFIEREGKRVKEGNFCISNSRAVKLLCEGVLKFLDSSDVKPDILHLWFDDVLEGSWCSCDACKNLTPLQQQNYAVNYVLQYIKPYYSDLKIDLLLYHDTLQNLQIIDISEKNIFGLYAPRERCYAHSLSEDCAKNKIYFDYLKDIEKTCGEKAEIFEYYSDIILFSKCTTVIPHTIAGDLSVYHNCGIKKIGNLAFGNCSVLFYGLNDFVFARHSFDSAADIESTMNEYFSSLGEDDWKTYFELLEKYSCEYFAFCGYIKTEADIRKLPISEYYKTHLKKIKNAINYLTMANKLLENFIQNDFVKAQKILLQITYLESVGILNRMIVRLHNFEIPNADKTLLSSKFDYVQSQLYKIIEIAKANPEYFGNQLDSLIVEHLCKDQIWTINELKVQELKVEADLDRSKI